MEASLILCVVLLAVARTWADQPQVKLRSGEVAGIAETTDLGTQYFAFKGIKYAEAPVKQLRFKPPVPIQPWNGVKNASTDGHLCPQFDIGRNEVIGDEDCLVLNCYTTKLTGEQPVMVYIHGGSFINGGGPSYFFGPGYFMEQEVLLVAIQHRLGPFGFLSTGDEAAKGNWALQDVLLGLQWVKENIKSFGGNPDKITVFGEDSGAAIISLLMLSSQSEGLFHSAIVLSGNALCDQYLQRHPRSGASDLASRLDCMNGDDSFDLVDCLRRKKMQDIVNSANGMFMFYSFPRWWAPVIDGSLIKDEPSSLMKNGSFYKVPVVVGQTRNEGAFYYRLTLNSFNGGMYDKGFIDDKLPKILPVMSNYERRLYPITRAVRKRYFTNIKMHKETEFRPKYVDFLTDLLFTRCTDQFTRILANHNVTTYAYSFNYRGTHSLTDFHGDKVDLGVAHGDDLQYLFHNIWGGELEMSDSDVSFGRNIFTPLLTNFAKTSVPTPKLSEDISIAWPMYDTDSQSFYHIDRPLTSAPLSRERLRFWNEDIPSLFAKDMKELKRIEEEEKRAEKEKAAQAKKAKKQKKVKEEVKKEEL